jgi:hypothetical protein
MKAEMQFRRISLYTIPDRLDGLKPALLFSNDGNSAWDFPESGGKSLAQSLSLYGIKTIIAEFSDKLLHHKKRG